jgi:threonine/homoserine/homoserine lactone efflux protein
VDLLFFLAQVFIISCSGAMQPGPVTATVVTMGSHSRYAGLLLAVGHGIIEFPLMVVIILGMAKFFELPKVQIAIGLAGGVFLILMAIQSIFSLKAKEQILHKKPRVKRRAKYLSASADLARGFTTGLSFGLDKPILSGIILTASNPYFLVWWATVGLALATQAKQFGIWAFALFALTHWSVDLIWLQILSWASFKGSAFFGQRFQRITLLFCAVALLGFGLFFIYNAVGALVA